MTKYFTISKLSVYCSLIILCFHWCHGVLCLTYANGNNPQIQFYGFCKVIAVKKACPVIFRLDMCRVAAVKSLPALIFSADYILLFVL